MRVLVDDLLGGTKQDSLPLEADESAHLNDDPNSAVLWQTEQLPCFFRIVCRSWLRNATEDRKYFLISPRQFCSKLFPLNSESAKHSISHPQGQARPPRPRGFAPVKRSVVESYGSWGARHLARQNAD